MVAEDSKLNAAADRLDAAMACMVKRTFVCVVKRTFVRVRLVLATMVISLFGNLVSFKLPLLFRLCGSASWVSFFFTHPLSVILIKGFRATRQEDEHVVSGSQRRGDGGAAAWKARPRVIAVDER